MANIQTPITADVSRLNAPVRIRCKQGDVHSRYLAVTIVDLGVPVELSDWDTAVINAEREDGQSDAFACTISDNKVIAPIAGWMLLNAGWVRTSISVYSGGEVKLTTQTVMLQVEGAEYTGDDIDEDENYSILVDLINDVQNIVDTTLTVANKAADAKVTGNRLADLQSLNAGFYPDARISVYIWESGSISESNGSNITNNSRVRMANRIQYAHRRFVTFANGADYQFKLFCYTASSGGTFIGSRPASHWCDADCGIVLDPFRDGGAWYRIVVRRKDNSVIGADERTAISQSLQFRRLTDTSFTLADVPADAVETGKAIKNKITSLDEIAWRGYTYRDIFVDGDMFEGAGFFENGTLAHWNPLNGNPVINGTAPNYTLKTFSDSEVASGRISVTSDTQVLANRPYAFMATKINVTRLAGTGEGVGMANANRNSSASSEALKKYVSAPTDGWVTLGGSYRPTSASSSDYMLLGCIGAGIDADAEFSVPVWINLTETFGASFPTDAELIQLYNNYYDYIVIHPFERPHPHSEARTAFVDAMNAKAASLGMVDTTWNSMYGGSETTTGDLVRMVRAITGYPDLCMRMGIAEPHDVTVYGNNARTEEIVHDVGQPDALEADWETLATKSGTIYGSSYPYGAYVANVIIARHRASNRVFLGAVLLAHSADLRRAATKEVLDNAYYNATHDSQWIVTMTNADCGAAMELPVGNGALYTGADESLLFDYNSTTKTVPASVTKVMNVITTLDHERDMAKMITIRRGDIASGSGAIFDVGDKITIGDAIYAGMFISSNTAMNALGRFIGEKILNLGR